MNTATKALANFDRQQAAGKMFFTTTPVQAFEMIVNIFIAHVDTINISALSIDFKDGSIFRITEGSHVEHGFYGQSQDKRA